MGSTEEFTRSEYHVEIRELWQNPNAKFYKEIFSDELSAIELDKYYSQEVRVEGSDEVYMMLSSGYYNFRSNYFAFLDGDTIYLISNNYFFILSMILSVIISFLIIKKYIFFKVRYIITINPFSRSIEYIPM